MKNKWFYLMVLLFSATMTQAGIVWPKGKKAAVVLTYDDGLQSHLKIVMPQLEAKNFRGTFFLYGIEIKNSDIPAWKEAAYRGHELGNHSLYHPCLSGKEETGNCHSLECYTVKEMLKEIATMNTFLYAIDGKPHHAYAYPCAQNVVAGGEDFSKPLLESGLARYARGGKQGIITDTASLDYSIVPTLAATTGCKAEFLINYVKKAQEKGGLAVIVFHGVGGDYLTVEKEEHQKLVDYLAAHPDIWVTTFSEALDYLKTGKGKTGNVNTVASADSVKALREDTTGEFITWSSPYMAISFAKNFPMMSFFNVESGGRDRKFMDKSLLRPGLGGCLVSNGETSFGLPTEVSCNPSRISYSPVRFKSGKELSCTVTALSERKFGITVENDLGGFCGEFFRIATAPNVSPVSVWAEKIPQAPSDQYDTPVSIYRPKIVKASFRLPAVLHFPDYGLVKVEANEPDVYLQEHFLPDYENTGLNLGPMNRGGHPWRKSIHYGSIVLSFHSENPLTQAHLTFTVLEENYPKIKGCDFSGSRFDGLKRCWQNTFTVNPEHQTMGDNVLLEGIGHLSLGFKADLLPFTQALPGTYSMNEALKTSIGIALQERIGENNRIKDFGWECTEVTLISLYDYLLTTNDWDFVRKNIDPICRIVKGVLDTDTDHDGIFESPYHGNKMGNRESWNWWDDFAFGHKDAYQNLHAYRALTGMKRVFELLKMDDQVNAIDAQLVKFRSAFHKTFYNPRTGMYAGWISEDGKVHDYEFTFISSMAINEGLVPDKLGQKILKRMLAKLKEDGYDCVYGIPGPLIPVAKEDRGSWEEMSRWGRYENGGLCGQTAYHFIQALYNTGMRKEADNILFGMMATFEREYTHSGVFPGYQESVDWRTKGGAPCGYNYLADNYYFLLAAVTGYFGIKYPELKAPEQ